MSNSAAADLAMRFNRWLKRFSPPRQIAGNPEAMQDDANALIDLILTHAPAEGWQDWYDRAIRTLEAGMTTRAWPAPGEVAKACKAALQDRPAAVKTDAGDADAIPRPIDWFNRFGTQMPGMGNWARTNILIQRGILDDIAHARSCGFAVHPEDERKLLAERSRRREAGEPLAAILGPREFRRHCAVLAHLWDVPEFEARQRLTSDRHAPAEPDLSGNFVADDLRGAFA